MPRRAGAPRRTETRDPALKRGQRAPPCPARAHGPGPPRAGATYRYRGDLRPGPAGPAPRKRLPPRRRAAESRSRARAARSWRRWRWRSLSHTPFTAQTAVRAPYDEKFRVQVQGGPRWRPLKRGDPPSVDAARQPKKLGLEVRFDAEPI